MAPVFDMTLLFGAPAKKPARGDTGRRGGVEVRERQAAPAEEKAAEKAERTPAENRTEKAERAPAEKREQKAMPEFAFLGNAASGREKAARPARETRETRESRAQEPAAAREKKEPVRPVREAKEGGQGSDRGTNAPAAAPAASAAPVLSGSANNGSNGANNANASGGSNAAGSRRRRGGRGRSASASAPETPEEALKAEFLRRLRSLGGDYFEYYSVYLLERYSMRNGRRLEGLKVSGGEHDGGIDGEIELTDKFGFRETIYIQAKNWDPSKGDLEKWVVGETLLQQFIGAVACRLAREGKQHSRGIFVTTSRFTPDAKALLETMSDRFIGYDADDVFEAAKECSFGLLQKDGEWTLDEELLSGGKAFFNMM